MVRKRSIFYPHDLSHSSLGYEYANKVASEGSIARKIHKKIYLMKIYTNFG